MCSVLDQSSALQFSDLSERTFYGEYSTGIFSYTDLTANLNGLRFWNEISALKPDPIAFDVIPAPYIRCVDKKWLLSRAFDWQDYIDPIWGEALNCNAYKIAFWDLHLGVEITSFPVFFYSICSSIGRTASTGQGACRITRSVVDPTSSLSKRVCPLIPKTIMSISFTLAYLVSSL